MTVRMIWAEARDRVIGADGGIPWHLPEDLRHFKERTIGATVVMGRGTWESLPPAMRPLPGRRNVVLTRDPRWAAPGAERAGSVADVLAEHDDVWVIGGAEVYAAFLPHAAQVVRTVIDLGVAGDARAPELGSHWRASEPVSGWSVSRTGLHYRVEEWERLRPDELAGDGSCPGEAVPDATVGT
jgi:dihydrofolate reductase